jgi:hypothetical protein
MQHKEQTRSLNPTSGINKNSALIKVKKESPNIKRIVNIYSMNSNYKKKKYAHIINNSIGGAANANNVLSSGVSNYYLYKGEDIKQKLQ